MINIFLVGLGGAFGAMARYGVAWLAALFFHQSLLPYDTMIINILGCFLIGLLVGLGQSKWLFSPETYLLLSVGFLGGFTTFSTFAFEAFHLIAEKHLMLAFLDVVFQTFIGIAAVWFGYVLAVVVI